jgi:REP element-mobilizing transposase RayT
LFASVRPFYFLTFNTHRRMKVLADGRVFATFVSFAERAHSDHAVAVGRFVIMPDHIHLFVALPCDGPRLGTWVKALKSVLGKTLLQSGIPNPHCQEEFFDHVLRGSDSYSQKWEYVRQNPVRAGLVNQPEAWPWQAEIVRLDFCCGRSTGPGRNTATECRGYSASRSSERLVVSAPSAGARVARQAPDVTWALGRQIAADTWCKKWQA